MEFCVDGWTVRLRSRLHGTYLFADDDGLGISMRPHRASLNAAAWTVHRFDRDGTNYALLHGAAYGRYLAMETAQPGRRGRRVVQRVYDAYSPGGDDVLWEILSAAGGADDVVLRHGGDPRWYLASIAVHSDRDTCRDWVLEVVLPRLEPAICQVPAPQRVVFSRAMGYLPAHHLGDFDESDREAAAAAATPSPPFASDPAAPDAMELFSDRTHVRLRSRVHGGYLHADEDGVGVSLSPNRASLNTAWAVHRFQGGGTTYILLHSAAYGRYLALAPEHLHQGSFGAVQSGYFNDLPQLDIMWVATRNEDGDIFLSSRGFDLCYRPDGLTAMRWIVETIPSRGVRLPPPLPDETPNPMVLRRIILYMTGDHYGNIDYGSTRVLIFEGRSVSGLRYELASLLEEEHPVRATLCVWAGFHGRLTPLVMDLPCCNETLEIVIFKSWSQAAQELGYPDVDAP